MADRAAHDDQLLERLRKLRLLTDRQRDVRQRTDRHQRDLSGAGQNLLDQKIASMLDDGPASRFREFCVSQACVPVRLRREQGRLHQWQFTTLRQWDVARPR